MVFIVSHTSYISLTVSYLHFVLRKAQNEQANPLSSPILQTTSTFESIVS